MKHLLLVSGLFAVAASFSLQVTAADEELCAANIQALQDQKVSTAETFPEVKKLVEETLTEAKADQAKGDSDKCVIVTRKALLKLRTYNN